MTREDSENKRAERILFIMNICHSSLDDVYEGLVDRDFELVRTEIRNIIVELKLILKSIDDDDF